MKRSAEPLLDDVSPNPAKTANIDELQRLINSERSFEFIPALQRLVAEHSLTVTDLLYQLPEGPDKGKSVLWWSSYMLFFAARPEAFFAVLDEFKHTPSLQSQLLAGLLAQAQTSSDKGQSALWLLAHALLNGNPFEGFLAVLDKFKDAPGLYSQLLEGLLVRPQRYRSALSLLAAAVGNGKHQAFLAVWDKFKDVPDLQSQLLAGLLTQTEDGPYEGMSALYCLVTGDFKPEVFFAVWDKFKDVPSFESQLLDGLLAQSRVQSRGTSVLYSLAHAVRYQPEAFFAVWNKFKDTPDLQSQLLAGLLAHARWCTPETAMSCLIGDRTETIDKILINAFALIPASVAVDNPGIKRLIELNIVSANLINARNAFFKTLENAKFKYTLEHADIETLADLADEAEQQGYVNAFYDLGHFIDYFEQKEGDSLAPVADEIYEHVTPLSTYYEWVCIRLSESKFNLARFEQAQRNTLLHDSLKFALDIKDPGTRLKGIQRVASLYIFDIKYSLYQLPIQTDELLLMRDKNHIELYFRYLDEVKKIVEVEEDIKKQMADVKGLDKMLRNEEPIIALLQQGKEILPSFNQSAVGGATTASPEIRSVISQSNRF